MLIDKINLYKKYHASILNNSRKINFCANFFLQNSQKPVISQYFFKLTYLLCSIKNYLYMCGHQLEFVRVDIGIINQILWKETKTWSVCQLS